MIVVYLISALWSFGCLAAPLCAVVSIWRDGDRVSAAILAALALPIAFLLGAVPWAFMAEQASPDLDVLKRGQWTCTSHTTT